jgi:RHS repeat-associated protein
MLGTLYWRGKDGEVLDESNRSGQINEEYVYFGGARLARLDPSSGSVHYYFSNHLGSADAIADNVGNVQQQVDYYPYGGVAYTNGFDGNRYKFTGKERDSESGLDNFTARYFGSSLGRFMTPDPMGGDAKDPQSLNRYAYVRNNPLTLTDPTGLNFGLPCSGETDKCHNGLQGSWQHDDKGNKTTFTDISIGNKDGKLQDVSSNKTGAYTASFDGKNVSLTNSAGTTQNGSWIQGTDPVKGISGGGDLGKKFTFDFFDHGEHQQFNFDWKYSGTASEAARALEKAKFEPWSVGLHSGDEFRLPASRPERVTAFISLSMMRPAPRQKRAERATLVSIIPASNTQSAIGWVYADGEKARVTMDWRRGSSPERLALGIVSDETESVREMVGSTLYRLGVVARGWVDSYLAREPVVVGLRLRVCLASSRAFWSADVGQQLHVRFIACRYDARGRMLIQQ